MRLATRYCAKGHDKDEQGRDKLGACMQCRREASARARLKPKLFNVRVGHTHDALSRLHLPIGPLLDYMKDKGLKISDFDLATRKTFHRAQRSGLASVAFVDAVCCQALGVNPALVYGPMFYEEGA